MPLTMVQVLKYLLENLAEGISAMVQLPFPLLNTDLFNVSIK